MRSTVAPFVHPGSGPELTPSYLDSLLLHCRRAAPLVALSGLLLPTRASAQVQVQIGAPPPAVAASPVVQIAPAPAPPVMLGSSTGPGGGAPVDVRMSANRPGVMLEQLRGSSSYAHSWRNRDGSTGSQVEERQNWQPLCQAPCAVRVDSAAFFRIGGPGIKRSPSFMMPGETSQIGLRAEAGNVHRYRTGVALLVIGSVFTLGGLVAVALAENARSYSFSGGPDKTLQVFGYPTLVIGLGSLGAGIPLYLFNRTSVTQEGGMRLARIGGGLYLSGNGLAF